MSELHELPEDFEPEETSADLELQDTAKAFEAIKDRCLKAGMKCEERSDEGVGRHLVVTLPSGRQERDVYVVDLEDAQALLNQPFEKFVFISGYDAICSYDEDFIEASINPTSTALFRRRLFGISSNQEFDPTTRVIEIKPVTAHSTQNMLIHLASTRLSAVLIYGPRPSLIIENIQVHTHDRALEVLENVANSLFFEVDVRFNMPLSLARARVRTPRPIPRSDELVRKPLQFPTDKYDKQAASLYWYGRMATGMPLLRFLAFYQTIEFYFPIYSQHEAIKHIRGLLKHPTFSIYDDKSIIRLLSALQAGRPNAFGDERSQLRATLQSCLVADGLRTFLTSDDQIRSFFSTPAQWKVISEIQIPINKADADLRNDVADRIYDIRCKVVHTKSDAPSGSGTEVLLPFSKEADLLSFDIELVQYVARQVLIMSSSKLTL